MPTRADLLITNARIITVDPLNHTAEALAIAGRHIVFVGSMDEAQPWISPSTRIIDAQGCTVMPGLIDSHYHLMLGSLELSYIQLDQARSWEDVERILRQYINEHPDEASYDASQLRYSVLPPEQRLTRHHLDRIMANRPLIIMAFDAHTYWVNTRALEIAGMLHGANFNDSGGVVMDADGTATGELRESAAYAPLLRHFDAWARVAKSLNPDADIQVKSDPVKERQALRAGLKLAAQVGITSVHNMDGDFEQARFYAAMEDSGDLTLRVSVPYSVTPDTRVQDLDEADDMTRTFQGDMVRAGRAKFFMDGVIESWTAFFLGDYADRASWIGESLYSAEHFNRMAAECDRRGLQIAVHAIGDAAVRRTLDGYAYARQVNGARDSRHRIEHIELLHLDDVPRFAQLGVIAAMQPYHAPLDYSARSALYLDRIGRDRWHRTFAWQNLRGGGARLVFGSDWSVVSPNPMLGFHSALTRQAYAPELPDHRQSLADIIASYTRDGAYAEFQEHLKGQIKVGMLADMVILSADLYATAYEEMGHVHPIMTICDGRIVYER